MEEMVMLFLPFIVFCFIPLLSIKVLPPPYNKKKIG